MMEGQWLFVLSLHALQGRKLVDHKLANCPALQQGRTQFPQKCLPIQKYRDRLMCPMAKFSVVVKGIAIKSHILKESYLSCGDIYTLPFLQRMPILSCKRVTRITTTHPGRTSGRRPSPMCLRAFSTATVPSWTAATTACPRKWTATTALPPFRYKISS